MCKCHVARASPEASRSGFVAVTASEIDRSGANPRYAKAYWTAVVLVIGWPGGHTACTVQPAFARATARRAVGNHRDVVTTRTPGFNFRPFDGFPRRAMRQSQYLRYGETSYQGSKGNPHSKIVPRFCFAHRQAILPPAAFGIAAYSWSLTETYYPRNAQPGRQRAVATFDATGTLHGHTIGRRIRMRTAILMPVELTAFSAVECEHANE